MVVIIGMWGEPVATEATVMSQQPELCCVFSGKIVPGSQDPGSGGLHRLLGGVLGVCVISGLCLNTGFLVAVATALAFHAHLWCPS